MSDIALAKMTSQATRGATLRQSPPSKRDVDVTRTLDANQNRARKMGSGKRVYRLVLTGGKIKFLSLLISTLCPLVGPSVIIFRHKKKENCSFVKFRVRVVSVW